MGTMTGLATIATALTVLLVVAGVVLAAALAVLVVEFFAANRPRRLARHESAATYYLRGHAFGH